MADDTFSDEIWGETDDTHNQEWNRMLEQFTNAGYREGITAGKEGSLQEGFDEGFATIGVPLGRDIGRLRGIASVCVHLLSSSPVAERSALVDSQDVLRRLGQIRFQDLVPRDIQAEEHLKEHLQSEEDWSGLSATTDEEKIQAPAVQELEALRTRLRTILKQIGIPLVQIFNSLPGSAVEDGQADPISW